MPILTIKQPKVSLRSNGFCLKRKLCSRISSKIKMQDYVQINNYANINNKTTQGFFTLKRFFERKHRVINSAPEFPLKLICKIMNMRCVIECHHTKHIIFYPVLRLIRSALCFSLQIPTCPRIPVLSLSCRSKIAQERDKTPFVKRERREREREGGGATHLFHRGLLPIEKNMILVHIHVTYMYAY